ncbi:type VII secretion target [Embleya sp. MST-111070]|uniref:type VII secretion target n=1 Tax=Embleya sp. MST-111070 TaxID=3398231 RepID=UPI003F73FA61
MAGGSGGDKGSSGRIRVETGALRQGAGVARDAAEALRRAAGGPSGVVAGCPGFAIVAAVEAVTAAWVAHLRGLADGYAGMGDLLVANADAHDRADRAAAGVFAEGGRRW